MFRFETENPDYIKPKLAPPTTGPPTKPNYPLHADRRNFYKVEKWSRDGQRVEELLFAGNSLAFRRRLR